MLRVFISFLFLLPFTLNASEVYKELDKKQTYLTAVTECKKLGPKWRLPKIWELFLLKGDTKKFGTDKRYWSKTSLKEKRVLDTHTASDEFFVQNKDIPAFAFYLQDGDVTPTPKFIKAHVLCTNKDIKVQNEKYFTKTEKGVKDTLNNILWEPLTKDNKDIKLSYEDAQDICDTKTQYERSWRLPSLDELYSIVNYNYVKPSVNTDIFSDMKKKYYWSDDEFGNEAKTLKDAQSYVVGFSIGSVATSLQKNKSYFRCVSDLEN